MICFGSYIKGRGERSEVKKKKLLTVILSFILVFSSLVSVSSMVLAEEAILTESITGQEVIEDSADHTVSDEVVEDLADHTAADEGIADSADHIVSGEGNTLNEAPVEMGDLPSDELNEEGLATDAVEEKTEDDRLLEDDRFLLEDKVQMNLGGEPGYIGWTTSNSSAVYKHALFIAKEGVNGTTEAAYCYNFDKALPGTRGEGFTKIANASAATFDSMAQNSKLHGEELKKKILQICYEGYPKNSKGLQGKHGISNDEFNLITQAAVWYYTDSKDNIMETGGYFSTRPEYSKIISRSNVKRAFYELIHTNVQLPSNYQLDLYYPTGTNSKTQNMLSTKLKKDTARKFEFFLDKRNEEGQGLSGAKLQLLYSNNSLIYEWTSDGNARLFEAEAGNYIFRETQAPEGYERANDIHFNIDNNGNVTSGNGTVEERKKVVMIDRQSKPKILIRKIDPNGDTLPGAELQILNSSGDKVIHQWTTGGTEESIVIDSGDYMFRETNAPQGYEKVSDINFSVEKSGDITLKDTLDYAKAEGNKLIVTDSKEIPKTTRKVKKEWRDAGFENERPKFVKIQLFADGEAYEEAITLNDANGWMYEWKDLPSVDKNAKEIEYTVQEVGMDGKTIGIDYIPNYGYSDKTGVGIFTVTNIKGLELVVSKEVIGHGGDKSKEFTFEIELNFMDALTHKDPIKYEGSVLQGYEGEVEAPEGGTLKFDPQTMKATIKLKHGQQITLKNILYTPGLKYTVKELEENQDDYKTTYNGDDRPATGECIRHIEVRVKNSKEGTPPPTGIVNHENGAGILFGISIAGLLVIIICYILRKCKGLKR